MQYYIELLRKRPPNYIELPSNLVPLKYIINFWTLWAIILVFSSSTGDILPEASENEFLRIDTNKNSKCGKRLRRMGQLPIELIPDEK